MKLVTLNDEGQVFEASVLKATKPRRTVLFASGSGGNLPTVGLGHSIGATLIVGTV